MVPNALMQYALWVGILLPKHVNQQAYALKGEKRNSDRERNRDKEVPNRSRISSIGARTPGQQRPVFKKEQDSQVENHANSRPPSFGSLARRVQDLIARDCVDENRANQEQHQCGLPVGVEEK